MDTPATPRTLDQKIGAAHVVIDEWRRLGSSARLLGKADIVRTDRDNAAMDSAFVHARCLINFLCGNYMGTWQRGDIKPADFLGHDWFPDDNRNFDRELRGRLRIMNKAVVHATWDRVTSDEAVIWSMIVVAHQVSFGMRLFGVELDAQKATSDVAVVVAPMVVRAWEEIEPMLPPISKRTGETRVPLAPERS
jgi:hypothetical protein